MARLSSAATVAYAAARVTVADPRPVTAALTALLIVQVTLVGTLADSALRIVSVVIGVGTAIAVSTFVGFTWWSMGSVVAVSLLLGQLLRLGEHLLEVPISAMLILAAGGAGVQATDRVVETMVGAAVGVLVNLILPPRPQTGTAGAAIEGFAAELAGLLERVARAFADGPISRDRAGDWLAELRAVADRAREVDRVLDEARDSRRLNPRVAGTLNPLPDLRGQQEALEHSAVALRSLFRSIADGGPAAVTQVEEADAPGAADVRTVLATLVDDLARSVTAFGAMVRAGLDLDPDTGRLVEALDAVREGRARLTELLLVDAREATDRWQLHGSLLAAVERVLAELDVEELARRRERHRQEALGASGATSQAAQRLRSRTRRLMEQPQVLRIPRRR